MHNTRYFRFHVSVLRKKDLVIKVAELNVFFHLLTPNDQFMADFIELLFVENFYERQYL